MCGQSRVPSALSLRHIITFTYYFGQSSREHSGHAWKIFRHAHNSGSNSRVNSGTDSDLWVLRIFITRVSLRLVTASSIPPCRNHLRAFNYLYFPSFSFRLQVNYEKRRKKNYLTLYYFFPHMYFPCLKQMIFLYVFNFEWSSVLVHFCAFEIYSYRAENNGTKK